MPFARQSRGPRTDEAEARARLEQLLARSEAERVGSDPWLDPVDGAEGDDAPADGQQATVGAPVPEPASGTETVPGPQDRVPSGRHRAAGGGSRPARPAVLTVPRSLRTARYSVRPAAVLGMLVVLVAAGAVFGFRVWQAGAAGTPQPVPVVRPVGEDGDAAHATSDGTGPVTSDAEGEPVPADGATTAAPVPLVVHVSGAVHRPGVVELSPGARVQEAVAAAGGLTGEADPDRLNLARPLNDGERVWVPVPGEEEPDLVGPETGPTPAAQPGEPAGGAAGPVVDLNAADQSALEELPGVGPVTAGRIVAWREEHGRFSSAEELLEVSGIGERTLEQLRPHLTW